MWFDISDSFVRNGIQKITNLIQDPEGLKWELGFAYFRLGK
jgi:hypothetical protein